MARKKRQRNAKRSRAIVCEKLRVYYHLTIGKISFEVWEKVLGERLAINC